MNGKQREPLIRIWRCIHCERVTILDENAHHELPWDNCECGAEFYPVSRTVKLGYALPLDKVAGEPLDYLVKPRSDKARLRDG